uniref:Secreted protein n=1 Tax=Trichuris muris TaxID=70415 RepID=A0A5S6QF19_TRIMR
MRCISAAGQVPLCFLPLLSAVTLRRQEKSRVAQGEQSSPVVVEQQPKHPPIVTVLRPGHRLPITPAKFASTSPPDDVNESGGQLRPDQQDHRLLVPERFQRPSSRPPAPKRDYNGR